jgi:hypothetical protein
MSRFHIFLILLATPGLCAAQDASVACDRSDGRVRVTVGGEPFTTYVFGELKRPCLWPVFAPGGVRVTRSWPLGDAATGEEKDHPHHTGVWFGHGNVNGMDFWHPQSKTHGGRVEITKWIEDPATTGRIKVRQRWSGPDGKPMASDETTLAFGAEADVRWIDWTVRVIASHGPLRFGDTKEGTLGVRMHPALRLEGSVAAGKVLTATGKTGKGIWGKRAAWIDYYGEVGGKTIGLAIMDHPGNPRHPTWWHARAYGLCAANPFGTRAFEGKKQPKGDFLIASGESVTFRWRLVLHRGDAKSAHIGDRHRTWGTAPAKSGKR